MKIQQSLLKFGLVTLMFFVMSCGGNNPQEKPGGREAVKDTVFAVQTMVLKPGDITNYIRVNGEIRNATSVDVFPNVAGKISRILVSQGQFVQRDQVLLYVDPSRPGAEFVESPVDAPISGIIVSFPFSLGATVGPQTPVAKIAREGDLELVTSIAERFAAQVKPGLVANVNFEAFPGRTFTARVVFVSPVLDTLSRTLETKLRLDNPAPSIRAGMFADVKIITEVRRRVLRVPSDAVVSRFGETFVFVAKEDGTAEKRIIVKGIEIDNITELVEGVQANERVIIRGQTLLENGSKIRVIDQGGES
jgi:multidrug efflux pump subunit AcrA (membrane-fusion protein)